MTLTDPVSPDLKRHLRTLKLGQLLATLPDRLTLARQNKLPHADFLELLLSDEVAIPWKCGHFLLADSCNFASSSDYRTPVHFAALAFAGTGGPVVTGRAAPWGGAG